jgi:hypothetical protein
MILGTMADGTIHGITDTATQVGTAASMVHITADGMADGTHTGITTIIMDIIRDTITDISHNT